MAKDLVHPLKMESPSSGGTELDPFPSALDHNEDHVSARGSVYQNNTSNDEKVGVSRTGDSLTFQDDVAGGGGGVAFTLSDLLAGGFDPHKLIITSAGGLLYDSNGEIIFKEVP